MKRRLLASAAAAAVFGGLWAAVPATATATAPVDVRLPAGAGAKAPVVFLATYDPARTSGAALARTIAAAGGHAHVYRQFPVVGAVGGARVVGAVTHAKGVTVVEPNSKITFFDNASVHAVNADTARAATPTGLGIDGSGVTVGIIDTGADGTNPDLAQRLNKNVKVVTTWLACANDDPLGDACPEGDRVPSPVVVPLANTDTTSGHGSHVAGIVAGDGTASSGLYTGVAPGASIDAVGVGDGDNIVYSLDGFEYLLAHATEDNIVAINNSWGPLRQAPSADSNPATGAVPAAITEAISRGIAVVFAAGNDGVNLADDTVDYCAASQPFSTINPYALVPGVISAAASSRDGLHAANFSSCGKGTADRSHDPTLMAPGANIVSVRGGPAVVVDPLLATLGQSYTEASGTSMAAPHVAGAIALIQSAREKAGLPHLTPAQLKTTLASTAQPLAGVQPRKQGAGLMDVAAAIAQATSVATPSRLAAGCPTVTDLAGDATAAVVNTPAPSTPSLDVLSATLSSTATSLDATIKLAGLDLIEPTSPDGLYYDVNFSIGDVNYYLAADYRHVAVNRTPSPSAGVLKFTYTLGRYDTTRTALVNGTGSFDIATKTVTASVPLSVADIYNFTGATLHTITVVSRREFNSLIADADHAYGNIGYLVGSPGCV